MTICFKSARVPGKDLLKESRCFTLSKYLSIYGRFPLDQKRCSSPSWLILTKTTVNSISAKVNFFEHSHQSAFSKKISTCK